MHPQYIVHYIVHYRIALTARGVRPPPPRSVNVLRVAPPPGGKGPIPKAKQTNEKPVLFPSEQCSGEYKWGGKLMRGVK